jgi:hypothetical protein
VKIHSQYNTKKIKKMIFFATLTIPLMAGIIFTGYWSSTQKQKVAQTKMVFANLDLIAAQEDANATTQVVATPEEWNTFKSESELKIRDNEIRITELYVKLKNPGKIFDAPYEKKIALLDLQNKDMKARLEAYEKIQSNWETFRREFNHDMVGIGDELKYLTVDNRK